MKLESIQTVAASLAVLITLTPYVDALQCSKHDILKKYKIDKYASLGQIERDTPPSKTTEKWWVNPCEESKADINIPSLCYQDDVICGLTEVLLPGKDPLVTQVINFSKKLAYSVEEVDDTLVLSLKSTKWGSNTLDARLEFSCDDKLETDELSKTTWQNNQILLSIKGPSGCLKNGKDKDSDGNKGGNNNDDHNDKGDNRKEGKPREGQSSGTSWFLWLVLYALLFTVICLVVVSYMNTRGGSFDDFRTEFIERATELITSLPQFTKEIVNKVLGRDSARRTGYSAV
ncbi:hypothetical protein NCAS_0I02950 [Naumovozyma castellii]|uniref:Autophagy-related protein 27 n=1 Tax=Naumovozyma castellii TaxID=27288 RepID=G0VKC9_NAUCA|nr:hypothetical protein NCAS_0I02950 [Naumovozyma castellii CBS 4309]CCC71963.1 hypothetical protein NCAS_0I02950 [Naumovozyma castellii CBS 4309]